jgi:hypothetical protein
MYFQAATPTEDAAIFNHILLISQIVCAIEMLKEHLARRKTRRTTIGGRIKDNLWKS